MNFQDGGLRHNLIRMLSLFEAEVKVTLKESLFLSETPEKPQTLSLRRLNAVFKSRGINHIMRSLTAESISALNCRCVLAILLDNDARGTYFCDRIHGTNDQARKAILGMDWIRKVIELGYSTPYGEPSRLYAICRDAFAVFRYESGLKIATELVESMSLEMDEHKRLHSSSKSNNDVPELGNALGSSTAALLAVASLAGARGAPIIAAKSPSPSSAFASLDKNNSGGAASSSSAAASPKLQLESKFGLLQAATLSMGHREKGGAEADADVVPEKRQKSKAFKKRAKKLNDTIAKHKEKFPLLKSLKIDAHADAIVEAVKNNNVVVITGATGCGKTTRVPQFLLHAMPDTKIVVAQPRRVATLGVARRVSKEVGCKVGELVGYAIGGMRESSELTRILFVTPGILINFLAFNDTPDWDIIVLDEIHERGTDTDLLLQMAREIIMRGKRIKVVLMSATITAEMFQQYMEVAQPFVDIPIVSEADGKKPALPSSPSAAAASSSSAERKHVPVPLIHIPDHQFTVRELYLEDALQIRDMPLDSEQRHKLIKEHDIKPTLSKERREAGVFLVSSLHMTKNTNHAILVFFPGIGSIMEFKEDLERVLEGGPAGHTHNYEIHIAHSTINIHEQAQILRRPPRGVRKIVLSTNICESSITIDDVSIVIDFLLRKEKRFDRSTGVIALTDVWISRDSAKQRRGRAGRCRKGILYRMIPRPFFFNDSIFDEQRQPELQHSCLQQIILRLSDVKWATPQAILQGCMSPPAIEAIQMAIRDLLDIGALTASSHEGGSLRVTAFGHILSRLPVDIHLGHLIVLGYSFKVLDLALLAAALTSKRNIILSPRTEPIVSARFKAWYSKLNFDYEHSLVDLLNEDHSFTLPNVSDNDLIEASDLIAGIRAYTFWQHHRKKEGFPLDREEEWCRYHWISLFWAREVEDTVIQLKDELNKMGMCQRPSPEERKALRLGRLQALTLGTRLQDGKPEEGEEENEDDSVIDDDEDSEEEEGLDGRESDAVAKFDHLTRKEQDEVISAIRRANIVNKSEAATLSSAASSSSTPAGSITSGGPLDTIPYFNRDEIADLLSNANASIKFKLGVGIKTYTAPVLQRGRLEDSDDEDSDGEGSDISLDDVINVDDDDVEHADDAFELMDRDDFDPPPIARPITEGSHQELAKDFDVLKILIGGAFLRNLTVMHFKQYTNSKPYDTLELRGYNFDELFPKDALQFLWSELDSSSREIPKITQVEAPDRNTGNYTAIVKVCRLDDQNKANILEMPDVMPVALKVRAATRLGRFTRHNGLHEGDSSVRKMMEAHCSNPMAVQEEPIFDKKLCDHVHVEDDRMRSANLFTKFLPDLPTEIEKSSVLFGLYARKVKRNGSTSFLVPAKIEIYEKNRRGMEKDQKMKACEVTVIPAYPCAIECLGLVFAHHPDLKCDGLYRSAGGDSFATIEVAKLSLSYSGKQAASDITGIGVEERDAIHQLREHITRCIASCFFSGRPEELSAAEEASAEVYDPVSEDKIESAKDQLLTFFTTHNIRSRPVQYTRCGSPSSSQTSNIKLLQDYLKRTSCGLGNSSASASSDKYFGGVFQHQQKNGGK